MKSPIPTITPLGDRLKHAMKKHGISSAELAKRADVKTSFLYDVISGKSANPSTIKLARVARGLGISLASLVENEANPAQRAPEGYIAVPGIALDPSSDEGAILTLPPENESCYFSRSWIEHHLGAAPADLRLLSMRGDSMEPTLMHNDTLLIDTARKTPSPPGIFILSDGYGLVAKRLEYATPQRPPRLRIISDNPKYSVYERSMEESLIIGRVAWFGREI